MNAEDIVRRIAALPDQTTPSLRALRRECSRSLRDPREVIDVVLHLGTGTLARRFIGAEMITTNRAAILLLDEPTIVRLAGALDSWGAVDVFACYLSGPAWREGRLGDAVIARWARSRDRWWRRAALVSTVALNTKSRGGTGDPARTLAVCELLADDRDDMVVKAMSWALRALAARDAAAATKFVQHQADRLAARVVREVKAKIAFGRKK